jgi:O-methyltransferase involved in polyketide biosynthesis
MYGGVDSRDPGRMNESNLTGHPKIPLDLSGAPQTMLATLYAKALDADATRPVLGDIYARDLVSRLDYDRTRLGLSARLAAVTMRTAHFDYWARQFLAEHELATVLHLGCGLDSRALRLQPRPGVIWYDVDYPDVIALRARFYAPDANYKLVPASVTDTEWLPAIPADRPVLMVAEGLTMYLGKDDGLALLRAIVARFPSGELQFDVFNRVGLAAENRNGVVRRSDSALHWAVDGPDDILSAVPGTRLIAAMPASEAETFKFVPRRYRIASRMMSLVPALKMMAQFHRYAFENRPFD